MALPFSRHQLAWVSDATWEGWAAAAEPEAASCLAWWAAHRLPLVVSRQPEGEPGVALGLPAPSRWGRRKLALRCGRGEVVAQGHFPDAAEAARLLPPAQRPAWQGLCAGLAARGCETRVHGSHGWQLLTGLDHLREASDIDLLLRVQDAGMADAVCAVLSTTPWRGPRIDGELLLPGGAGVAWREWQRWRAGEVRELLVKRIDGVALEHGTGWLRASPEVVG